MTQLQGTLCREIHLGSLRTDLTGERAVMRSDGSQLQQCLYANVDNNGKNRWFHLI